MFINIKQLFAQKDSLQIIRKLLCVWWRIIIIIIIIIIIVIIIIIIIYYCYSKALSIIIIIVLSINKYIHLQEIFHKSIEDGEESVPQHWTIRIKEEEEYYDFYNCRKEHWSSPKIQIYKPCYYKECNKVIIPNQIYQGQEW